MINYPSIEFAQLNSKGPFIKRVIRLAVRKIFKKQIFKPAPFRKYPRHYFDAIFPAPTWFNTAITRKVIYWIADFQEVYLPHLFSKEDIAYRRSMQQQIIKSNGTLIFSSYDVLNDFERLYPESRIQRRVLQFAVTHPDYAAVDFEALEKKYGLPEQYFFCPNQFWTHKNQKVVLEAIHKLKQQFNKNIQVVFTGKAYDQRNDKYFGELQKIISDNDLKENVLILGFIDRKEQLQIMKHALAVIQPSFFEGWSTVVEDVKAMNQDIIVSGLGVHKEQLKENAVYFDPADSNSLAMAILNFKKREVEFNYSMNRVQFANNFLSIVDE